MKRRNLSWGILFYLIVLVGSPKFLCAQISEELKGIYRDMIPQMSGELREKLEQALQYELDSIELTPQQFKEFRDHPANPFSGWDQIDPDKLQGTINLQFETEPIRSRKPGYLERQYSDNLSLFEPSLERANVSESTVKITNGKKQLALGGIVSSDGFIITKASELKGHHTLFAKTHDDNVYEVSFVRENQSNDIALLKAEQASGWEKIAMDQCPTAPRFFFGNDRFYRPPPGNGRLQSRSSIPGWGQPGVLGRQTSGNSGGVAGH